MTRAKIRAALVAAVERDVRWLVEHKMRGQLDALTELAGWIWNYQSVPPTRQLGKTLIALAPVLPMEHLEHLAHGAAFYRHHDQLGFDRADELADQVLRDAGVDVDRYNGDLAAIGVISVPAPVSMSISAEVA